MDTHQIAWAAGLFEGEGTWILRAGGRNPQAALGMRDRDVVERFAGIVGFGSIRCIQRRERNPKHSDMWQWQLTNATQVRQLIEMFRPWLGERRLADAERILAGSAGVGSQGRSKYQTHCKRGHPFDEQNTGYNTYRASNGKVYTTRVCKQCRRDYESRRRR